MSRLVAATIAALVALLGLVYAISLAILVKSHLPMNIMLPVAGGFAVGIVLLQYFLGPVLIDHLVLIRWTHPSELGPDFNQWLDKTCRQFQIPMPRFGIIEEGSPNAFTYGNVPSNARVVVTRGVIDSLDPEELKAVVAHELGHIKHRDFIVMTLVQALVLALYTLYMTARVSRNRNSTYIVIASYLAYQLSYYISLYISRIREYMADYASAQIMSSGNPLSSALVKIAYGMAKFSPVQYRSGVLVSNAPTQPPYRPSSPSASPQILLGAPPVGGHSGQTPPPVMPTSQGPFSPSYAYGGPVPGQLTQTQTMQKQVDPRKFDASNLGAFGIAGSNTIQAAVAWQGVNGAVSADHFSAGARWELHNPWAKFAELVSTHPLTARRIDALQKMNKRFGVKSLYEFDLLPGGKYPYFWKDVLVSFAPTALFFLGFAGAAISPIEGLLLALVGLCLGSIIQLLAKYPQPFVNATIFDCLDTLEVSHVHAVPVRIEGKVTGRASAGMRWADNFIVQDSTGFIAAKMNQPFGLMGALWGFMNSDRYIGDDVVIYGWYRRFGAPMIEIDRIEGRASGTQKSYGRGFWLGVSLVGLVGFSTLAVLLLNR